ncbi:MAG TPA: archaetidylserine decarboxylase [Spirochaetota bacterium]|nr:archaetidylserine decarboxylase [Spirochaetota bacterium]
MANELLIFIFKIIPKSLLSRIFGYITRIPMPQFLLNPVIRLYSRKFGVRTEEILYPAGGFRTFNSFFTRKVKNGVHVIDSGRGSVVSPVDGRIDQFGTIEKTAMIQAKGISFSLEDLIPSATHLEFVDGSFMTLYLSPGDYHRIHSPVDGNVVGFFSLPGKLFTVQEFMVKGLTGLFTKNERMISYINTEYGLAGVCKVGAMNVGRIGVVYDEDYRSNRLIRCRKEHFFDDDSQMTMRRGDELGRFNLGSTIILLFQKDMVRFGSFRCGDTVRMGQKIGTLSAPVQKPKSRKKK